MHAPSPQLPKCREWQAQRNEINSGKILSDAVNGKKRAITAVSVQGSRYNLCDANAGLQLTSWYSSYIYLLHIECHGLRR